MSDTAENPALPVSYHSSDTDSTSMSRPRSTFHDVCSFGSVILRAGEGDARVRIRVSKEVMAMASPSFNAMLRGEFVEASQNEVDVQEEPQALLDFCNLVHCRADNVKNVDGHSLCALSQLADRRDATESVKLFMNFQLSKLLPHEIDYDYFQVIAGPTRRQYWSIWEIIEIAYTCDIRDVFFTATRYYMSYKSDRFECNLDERLKLSNYDRVEDIRDILETRRGHKLNHFIGLLKLVLCQCGEPCAKTHTRLGKITSILHGSQVFNILTMATHSDSVHGSWELVQTIAKGFRDKSLLEPLCELKSTHCVSCREGLSNRNSFDTTLKDMSANPGGLCLVCYKSGRGIDAVCLNFPCDKHV